jgi:hypothetical protein
MKLYPGRVRHHSMIKPAPSADVPPAIHIFNLDARSRPQAPDNQLAGTWNINDYVIPIDTIQCGEHIDGYKHSNGVAEYGVVGC